MQLSDDSSPSPLHISSSAPATPFWRPSGPALNRVMSAHAPHAPSPLSQAAGQSSSPSPSPQTCTPTHFAAHSGRRESSTSSDDAAPKSRTGAAQHPSPRLGPCTPPGGRQLLRFTMGYREDCELCRRKGELLLLRGERFRSPQKMLRCARNRSLCGALKALLWCVSANMVLD